jgi:hypothetical protein
MGGFLKHTFSGSEGQKFFLYMRHDGYFNATAMCRSAHKEWSSYHKSQTTKRFLDEISKSVQGGILHRTNPYLLLMRSQMLCSAQ